MLTASCRWVDVQDQHRHPPPALDFARVSFELADDASPTRSPPHRGCRAQSAQARRRSRRDDDAGLAAATGLANAAALPPRRRRAAGFASMTMAADGGGGGRGTRAGPVATLAAAGGAAAAPATGAPQWRVVLGNLAAGATAGAAVEAALYPIDTIKTRLQLMRSGGGLRALLQAGGGKALYSGVWGNLAGVMPASAIFMGVYEPVKRRVADQAPPGKEWLGPLVAGATAGVAASVVRVPTEVVKQRMQSGEFAAATAAVRSIVAREGVRGMFAGYGSFLLRDIPFDAIEFVAYEQLKRAYAASLKGRRDVNAAEVSAIGAAAGAITGVVTTPLDVLKTRLMTQGATGRYKGIVDCTTKIAREEGVATLFRGWEPRVLWIGLGGCVFFSALEQAKLFYAPKAADYAPARK